MHDDYKISVIVPIYNAEKYLRRCIDSILAQTFTDFELLLIDDGSKDKSGEICDEYARKDKRVKVFHKANEGISATREFGILHGGGNFIQFVDSDDWIEKTCLEDNLSLAEKSNADIIINDYYIDVKDKSILRCQKYNGNLIEDIFNGNVFGALWNKFFRADTIKSSGVGFIHNLSFCEDIVFLCELLNSAPNLNIVVNVKAYYHYQSNSASLTRRCTLRSVQSEEKYINVIQVILPSLPSDKLLINKLSVKWGYLKLGCLTFSEYKRLYPEICISNLKINLLKRMILTLSNNIVCYKLIRLIFKSKK